MFPDLLYILHCPDCSGELFTVGDGASALHCRHCGRKFPVISGIPVLFPSCSDAAATSGHKPL